MATALGLFMATALKAGLIGSAIGLSRAHRERDRAETSFQIARNAVDELFTRIDEQRQFEALGLQPVRATLLENLLRYYENIPMRRFGFRPFSSRIRCYGTLGDSRDRWTLSADLHLLPGGTGSLLPVECRGQADTSRQAASGTQLHALHGFV